MQTEQANTALHVLWTRPVTVQGKSFNMTDAEILTMTISALMWQKHHGSIKLYTDHNGLRFINKHHLENLWNGGIDAYTLEHCSYPIDPEIFWAAGKLIAAEAQDGPVTLLDTDLIVTGPVSKLVSNKSVVALHPEALIPDAYLPPHLLKKPAGFRFPAYYNWEVLPANTAFLSIQDITFKKFYLDESKKFMFDNRERPAEMVSQMVFAEQRLLTICAEHQNLPVGYLLENPFSEDNQCIIHLWGFKKHMRQNNNLQIAYQKQLLRTLADELLPHPLIYNALRKHLPEYFLSTHPKENNISNIFKKENFSTKQKQ